MNLLAESEQLWSGVSPGSFNSPYTTWPILTKLHRNVAGDQEKGKNEYDPSKTLSLHVANSMFYVVST